MRVTVFEAKRREFNYCPLDYTSTFVTSFGYDCAVVAPVHGVFGTALGGPNWREGGPPTQPDSRYPI